MLALACVVVACGDTGAGSEDRGAQREPSVAKPSPADPAATDRQRELARRRARIECYRAGKCGRWRVRRLPGGKLEMQRPGGARITVTVPSHYSVKPGQGCGKQELGLPDGSKREILVPPTPGLSAKLVGGSVRVRYDFGDVPSACRPSLLAVRLRASTHPVDMGIGSIAVKGPQGVGDVKVRENPFGEATYATAWGVRQQNGASGNAASVLLSN